VGAFAESASANGGVVQRVIIAESLTIPEREPNPTEESPAFIFDG
jgi:hypothetical protein